MNKDNKTVKDLIQEWKIDEGVNLKPFTKTDWYGWAGAEQPAPGVEPMIADVDVDFDFGWEDNMGTIIVDKNGVSLNGTPHGTSYAQFWTKDCGFRQGQEATKRLREAVTAQQLKSLGFTFKR